jgi:hypothetical protein
MTVIKVLLVSVIFCAGVAVGHIYNPTNIDVRAMHSDIERMRTELRLMEAMYSGCVPNILYAKYEVP